MTPGDIARQTRRALLGLCYRCDAPALPDRALCERHRIELSENDKRRRGKRPNKRGRCANCDSRYHYAPRCPRARREER